MDSKSTGNKDMTWKRHLLASDIDRDGVIRTYRLGLCSGRCSVVPFGHIAICIMLGCCCPSGPEIKAIRKGRNETVVNDHLFCG